MVPARKSRSPTLGQRHKTAVSAIAAERRHERRQLRIMADDCDRLAAVSQLVDQPSPITVGSEAVVNSQFGILELLLQELGCLRRTDQWAGHYAGQIRTGYGDSSHGPLGLSLTFSGKRSFPVQDGVGLGITGGTVSDHDKLQLTAPFRSTRESPTLSPPAADDETVAVIDIGSNTCRLVVARLWPDWGFAIVEETEASVRLAPTRPEKPIGRKALERAHRAFSEFRSIADSYNPGKRIYVATAAVRQAPNRERVVRLFQDWLGGEIRVISAIEEAEYAVVATINSLPALSGTVVDLGGGSVQVATYLGPAMTSSYSFPLGALLMRQRFLSSDPPKARELKQLRSNVREVLDEGRLQLPQPVIFIGGTVRALARLQQRLSGYRLGWPHGYTFTAFQLSKLTDSLCTSSTSEIARLPGVGTERADILAAGAVVLDEFCRSLGVKRLTVSGEGIRHGLLYRELERRGRSPGAARDRTIRTLRASHKEPPYIDAARAICQQITAAIPNLDPEVTALLPVAVELHRIGDTINVHKSDRSGQSIVASSELPGFSQREALLLALTLGSQESFRASKSDFGQPLQPADRAVVARLSALLRLTVVLARPLSGQVFFFHDGEVLRVTTPVVPFEADGLAMRMQDAFGFETEFVSAGGDQENGAERSKIV